MIGVAGHDDVNFIHSKDAGQAGRHSLGRYGGLEPLSLALNFPM
jgi:hypothetical protein